MSTDLGDHPVGHQAWFWAHDPAQMDVVLLALSHDDGSEWWQRTSRMVPAGNFIALGKLNKDVSSAQVWFARACAREHAVASASKIGWRGPDRLMQSCDGEQVGRLVNDKQIHVLITLNGWTSGNQVDVLALRPAPIQVRSTTVALHPSTSPSPFPPGLGAVQFEPDHRSGAQVEYMGSHDSLGADFVDLFVSDRVATPP
eukprot:2892874-Rhodomonas_salina.1